MRIRTIGAVTCGAICGALVLTAPAQAQILGGGVTGNVNNRVAGGPLNSATQLGADAELTVRDPEVREAIADVKEKTEARVEATERAAERSAAQAEARARVDARANARANVDSGVRVQAREDYDNGSYVYVENRGWVWTPRGATLHADGSVTSASGVRVR